VEVITEIDAHQAIAVTFVAAIAIGLMLSRGAR
jgi:hypothetical protein